MSYDYFFYDLLLLTKAPSEHHPWCGFITAEEQVAVEPYGSVQVTVAVPAP